jgi:hypothetical protein
LELECRHQIEQTKIPKKSVGPDPELPVIFEGNYRKTQFSQEERLPESSKSKNSLTFVATLLKLLQPQLIMAISLKS